MIEVKNKSLFFEKTSFGKNQNDDYIMTAKIVPFGIISRNGVMYDKESVIKNHKGLVGKPVLFNHKKDEDNTPPRGEWIGTEIRSDGMYGTAKIFNTTYNQNLIEYLLKAKNATVSLEIFGKAEKRIDEETGIQYNVAFIKEWLESSIVNLPGFNEAKVLSFECYIAESLGLGIQKHEQDGGNIMEQDLIEKVEKLSEKFDKQTELLEKIVEGIELQSESFKKLKEDVEVEAPEAQESTEAVEEPKAEEASEEVSEEPKAEEVKEEAEASEEVKSEKVEDKKEEDKKEEDKKEEDKKEEDKKEEDKKEEDKKEDKDKKEDNEEESEDEEKAESLNTEEVEKPQEPINVQKESAKVEFKEENKNINKEEMFREVLRKAFQK
jgi:hypothetical protein